METDLFVLSLNVHSYYENHFMPLVSYYTPQDIKFSV